MPTLQINVPGNEHQMIIEAGALKRLGQIAQSVAPHRRAMLIVDAAIAETHGKQAEQSLRAAGYDVRVHPMIADERFKVLATIEQMYKVMLECGVDRTTPVVALGGGLVGDTAGFAAATFLRGVPLIQAPTTLLAMVDASIGGKTGVNTLLPPKPGAAPAPAGGSDVGRIGKNLIGAFWQPAAIVADPETLRTLDVRQFRCGIAESIKHGVIADADLLTLIRDRFDDIAALEETAIIQLIERSAKIKISIVVEDERESGRRALLNLGHTFGHVIEPIRELDLFHGEAVAIGMCAAAHAGVLCGRLQQRDAEAIESLIAASGLPRQLRKAIPISALLEAMMFDKKVSKGKPKLILPTGLGQAEVVRGVNREYVIEAWRHVGAADAAA